MALSITKWVGSLESIVIHTVIFVLSFATVALGVFSFDRMLLVLTTILSLEAIYLSLFIQMTVNFTTETIEEVEQNIDEIQEAVEVERLDTENVDSIIEPHQGEKDD